MSELAAAVHQFDRVVEAWLERLRGNQIAHAVFPAASELGDFSLIWHLANAAHGIVGERQAEQSMVFAALLGVESLVVNQGFKRVFRRVRPTISGDERYIVRRPSTSSFPSGHASAAFFAATMFTARDGRRFAPLWFGIAGTIGTSRAYVRIHHPSDVVAGAVLGVGLASGVLAVLRTWARH